MQKSHDLQDSKLNFLKKKNELFQTRKLKGNALREYKKTIQLNQIQKEVIVGTLLGDACLPLYRGKPTWRVEFEQNIARAKYIQHLYDIFHNFVSTPPKVLHYRGRGARDRQCMRFRTFSHPELKFYDDLFYPAHPGCRRKKRVPESISELLTARALSYWLMDYGSRHTINQRRYYFFSTPGEARLWKTKAGFARYTSFKG